MIDFMIILGIILIILLIVIISRKCRKKEGFVTGDIPNVDIPPKLLSTLDESGTDYYIQVRHNNSKRKNLLPNSGGWNEINGKIYPLIGGKINENDPNIFTLVNYINNSGGASPDGQACAHNTIQKYSFVDQQKSNFKLVYKKYDSDKTELMKKRLESIPSSSNISCGHEDKTMNEMKKLCLNDDKCTSFTTNNGKPHCLKHHEVLTFNEGGYPGQNCYKKNRKHLNQLIHSRQQDAIIKGENVKIVDFKDITNNYTYENVPSITWEGFGVTYYFIKNRYSHTYIIKAKYTGSDKSQYIFKHEDYTSAEKALEISDAEIDSHTYFESDTDPFDDIINDPINNFSLIITKINPEIIDFITNNKANVKSLDIGKLKIVELDTYTLKEYNSSSILNIDNKYIYTLTINGNANHVCFIKIGDPYAIIKLDGDEGEELQYLHKTEGFKPFVFENDITIINNHLFTLKYNDNNQKIKDLKTQNFTPYFFNREDYGLNENKSYIINIESASGVKVDIPNFKNIDSDGYYRLYKISKLDEHYDFVTSKLKHEQSLYYLKTHGLNEIYNIPIGLFKKGDKYIIYDFSQLKWNILKYLTLNGLKEFEDYDIENASETIPTFSLSYVEKGLSYVEKDKKTSITQNLYYIGKNIKIDSYLQTRYNKYEALFKTLYGKDVLLYEISTVNSSQSDMEKDTEITTYETLYKEIKNKKSLSKENNIDNLKLYIYIKFFENYDGIKKLYISKHINLFKNDYYKDNNDSVIHNYILLKNPKNLNHFDFEKIAKNNSSNIILYDENKTINYCHKNQNATYSFYTINENYNYNFLVHDWLRPKGKIEFTKEKTEFKIQIIETTFIQYEILKEFKDQEIENDDVGITIKKGGYYLRLIGESFDFTDCMNVNDKKPLKVSKEENDNMDSKYVIKSDNQIWKNDNGQVYYFLNNQIYTIINYKPKLIPDLTIEYKPGIVAKRDDECKKFSEYNSSAFTNTYNIKEPFTNPKDKNIQYLIKNKVTSKYLTYTIEGEGINDDYVKTIELKTKTYYEDGVFQKSQSSIFYIGDNGDTFCYLSKIENLENRKINLGDIKPPLTHVIKDYKNIINTKRIKHIIGKLIGDNEVGYTIIKNNIKSVDGVFELVPLDEKFNLEKKELDLYEIEKTEIIDKEIKLDIQIKQLKKDITKLNNHVNTTIQKINTKITKIDKLLTKYEVHAKKNINQKLKDILMIIYKNYQIELDIILLRQTYQAKVQFSITLSTDEEYVQILKNEIDNAKFEIKRLELQIKEKNLKNYVNFQETNQIIGKVNDMIDIIQEKLDSLETKENFNNFNYHNKKHTDFNNIYDDISEKINSINIKVINNIMLYNNKIKLEENLKNLETYDTLLETKTKELEINYRTMFSKFDQDLYKLKNKLYSKSDNKDIRLKVLQRKFDIDNLQLADIKFNHIEKDDLELELMDLQDKIYSLNVNIKDINLINRAYNQLKELKKINLHIIKYRLMNTRAYEGFQNGSINTVKDIINRNDFGLSKSNEDNLTDFRSSQSLYNNENISIQPIPEDNTFKININNKCIEVRGDKNYSLKECNRVTPTQYFEAIKIRNKAEAIETNKVVPSNEKIKYPFYQMVSSISGNCLSLDDHGVSVIPCDTNSIQQHWKMKTHEKLCLDN